MQSHRVRVRREGVQVEVRILMFLVSVGCLTGEKLCEELYLFILHRIHKFSNRFLTCTLTTITKILDLDQRHKHPIAGADREADASVLHPQGVAPCGRGCEGRAPPEATGSEESCRPGERQGTFVHVRQTTAR